MTDKALIIILLFLLSGCASWTNHQDSITWPDGTVSIIEVSADGVITAKNGDLEITADHRGRPSVVEQILGVAASAVANPVTIQESIK